MLDPRFQPPIVVSEALPLFFEITGLLKGTKHEHET